MPELNHHLFQEIQEQRALWESIGERTREIRDVMEPFQSIAPALIQVTGRGSSAHAALMIAHFSERMLHIPARFFSIEDASKEGGSLCHAESLTYPRSVSFIVSQSGQSPDLLNAAAQLGTFSELTIAITNSVESSLSSMTDVHLTLGADEELAVAATKTFSGSVLLGMLAVAQLVGRAKVFASELRLAVSHFDYWLGIARTIPEELREDLQSTKRALIVAPPQSAPFAKEAALKLAENAGITAIGLSPSDALHGPLAQVTDDVTVVVLSTTDATGQCEPFSKRVEGMTKRNWRLDSQGFHQGVPEPHTGLDRAFGGLLELVPMQWLSGEMALRMHLDPDSPRALSKETLTR